MKKFIIRFAVFCLPMALFFLPVLYHLEKNHELCSVGTMASGSATKGSLIGLAYTDPMHLVKHALVAKLQPEVIALGTSRVLPFRSFYFANPEGFYNCGRSVGKIQDYRAFLESYPGKKPGLIVLGLDQDLFGGDAGDLDTPARSYKAVDSNYGTRMVKGTKAFYEKIRDEGFEQGTDMPNTGLFFGKNARNFNEGYRPDGSYLYGRTLAAEDNYLFSSTITRIDRKRGRFKAEDRVNPAAVKELESFLRLCKKEGIQVVSFLPPYASRVYDRLLKERESYPNVFLLHGELLPVFQKTGFNLFDFSDLRSAGSNDFEVYNGFHASEVAYLKMIRIMATDDETLQGRLNKPMIDRLISQPFSARQLVKEMREASPQSPNH